jgi:cysteine desulfurase
MIYLDHNATTPCDTDVVKAMLPYLLEIYGNPANGLHAQGRKAARAVDEARSHVAALIGGRPSELLFTGGATESNNLAILGYARAQRAVGRRRIVTSAIEHKAVLAACDHLAEEGFEVVVLPVNGHGQVEADVARAQITSDTLLVSLQLANNEVGTLQPVAAVAGIAHSAGAVVHCDATQAIGKVPVDATELGVDLMSLSGHKFYGPKGVGALYLRGGYRQIALEPLFYGGGQEHGIRSGTLNVPGIVGLGIAAQLASQRLNDERTRLAELQRQFERELATILPNHFVHAGSVERLPNTSSICFPGVDADALILNLDHIMVGTGSACESGAPDPSYVLQAMGVSRADAFSTIRVSMGRNTTAEEVDLALADLATAWQRIHAH